MRRFVPRLGRLWSNRDGGIAIVFALTLPVLAGVIALAVDVGRAYSLSRKLGSAADAAALAGAKLQFSGTASETEVRDRIRAYFEASTRSLGATGATVRSFDAVIDRTNGAITVTIDADLATTFGMTMGYDRLSVRKSSQALYAPRGIEFAMVLDVTGSMNNNGKLSSMKNAAKEAVDTLTSAAGRTGAVRIGLAPFSATVNAGTFANAVSGGTSTDNCVYEREGSSAYTDEAPRSGRYLGAKGNPLHVTNSHYACPNALVAPLSSDANFLKRTINDYVASGYTAGHIGLAWGWYLVSPNWGSIWPSAGRPGDYSTSPDQGVLKAVVLMTDGEFNTSYKNGPQNATSEDQARRLCAAMKAVGITIYSVAFDAPASAQTLLAECASSADQYFSAADGNALRAAFAEIATSVINKSLRIAY